MTDRAKYKVPVQSLIDHIKTATDVDDWAKEMAEELLKKQEPQKVINRYTKWNSVLMGNCPKCNAVLHEFDNAKACGVCGQQVKWK